MYEKEIELTKMAIANGDMPESTDESLKDLFELCYSSPSIFIACTDKTIFVGGLHHYFGDPLKILSKEIFWFSKEPTKDSLKVFKKFEDWSKEQGAIEIHMESLQGTPKVDELYKRKGYDAVSTIYRKKL